MKGWMYGVLTVAGIVIIGVCGYLFYPVKRTAFFYNQQVFAKFDGKIYLEKKLEARKKENRDFLDSLGQLIQAGRTDLTMMYDHRSQEMAANEAELSEQYTSEIWKFINESVKNYGDQSKYDFIFGATGDGSLMYAREANNITEDVVKHVNAQYADKPF